MEPRKDPTYEQLFSLWEVCSKWRDKHKPICAESILQDDKVNLSLHELGTSVTAIIGYTTYCEKCCQADVDCDCPECPGEDCSMCNGEACNKCGAGCWNRNPVNHCEHDVCQRHEEPDYDCLTKETDDE